MSYLSHTLEYPPASLSVWLPDEGIGKGTLVQSVPAPPASAWQWSHRTKRYYNHSDIKPLLEELKIVAQVICE
jgi:hypothetical protein